VEGWNSALGWAAALELVRAGTAVERAEDVLGFRLRRAGRRDRLRLLSHAVEFALWTGGFVWVGLTMMRCRAADGCGG
jgi:hypothetical protein